MDSRGQNLCRAGAGTIKDKDAIKTIRDYLDVRIDDYNGIVPIGEFSINLNEFVTFVGMNEGNQQELRQKFIQGAESSTSTKSREEESDVHSENVENDESLFEFKQDIHYAIHKYSLQGLRGTVEAAPAEKRSQRDQCVINLKGVFNITNRSADHFHKFKFAFLRFTSEHKLEHQEHQMGNGEKDVFISMNTLKLWLLMYDKKNEDIFDFRHYFVVMESIAIDNIQREMQSISEHIEEVQNDDDDRDKAAPDNTCCFYIIRLGEDSFKFGKTNVLKLRKASYDIGRLKQISFYAYIRLRDCSGFEKAFSRKAEEYKIRGKHELIRMPIQILDKILKQLMDESDVIE